MLDNQPWPYAGNSVGGCEILASALSSGPHKVFYPILYNRSELPLSDKKIGIDYLAPSIHVKRYENVIAIPRNVLLRAAPTAVLPDTFFRSLKHAHGGLKNDGKNRFYYRHELDCTVNIQIKGESFFLETDHPNVYGHVLLEALPRLWGLRHTQRDTKIITSIPLIDNYLKILKHFGITKDRIEQITRPTVCANLIVADPPISRRSWIHPRAWELFDDLKSIQKLSDCNVYEKIYISRSKVRDRPLTNEIEIENLFQSNGFVIIHPQEYTIEDQIKLFSNARCIAGTGGSGIHASLFSKPSARVLIICSDAWLVNADILLSRYDCRLGYVFGSPIKAPVKSHRSNTPWKIDKEEVRNAISKHFDMVSI